jgi:hypothetical protein
VICGRAIYSGDLDFGQAQAKADELTYLIGLSAFAVLAACIFVYWHIHQRIDGYRQKAGIYRQVVYVVLALPAMIYSLFGYIYRDF